MWTSTTGPSKQASASAMPHDEWVKAAAMMIKKEGSEQFLVNMLAMLRQSWME